MPQMYPMMWLVLYMMVIFTILGVVCSLYYFCPIMDNKLLDNYFNVKNINVTYFMEKK